MEDQRPFFKNMLKSTFKTKVGNPEEISSPVVSAIEENTRAIKDKEVAKQISKPIVTALVDVMEKIEKRKDADESEMNSLLERVKMLKGDQGESADEDFIISAVVPQVLEKVGEVIKPLIPEPIPGKNGDDYILTEKDKKEIAKSIKVPVVEKVIEKQFETIIEKQPVVTNEIKEVAVTDKAEVIKEKLESLEGDDRLDAKAIKNLPKSVFGGGGGIKRIDAANDTRIISPTNGQVLKWNSTRQVWENGTASGGGTGTVDTIVAGNNIDVDATDPANPIVSVETLTLADISDVTATATEVNYIDGVTSAIQPQLDGKFTLQAANVVNESGADVDQRFEGDTDQNLLFIDAGNDRIGIGTATPAEKLEVNGNIKMTASGAVFTHVDTGKINIAGVNVGINEGNPTQRLVVNGTVRVYTGGGGYYLVDRGGTSDEAFYQIQSAGSNKWSLGMLGDTTQNFRLYNNVLSASAMSIASADSVTTFAADVNVPDEAYGAGWNGSMEVPTKNALYDKIETLGGGSGITRSIVVTSGSATMGSTASTDYIYQVAGAHTMSLPAASGNTNLYTVKNKHSANITIDTAGAETIEGAASISIAPDEAVDIYSDGTNWQVK